MTAAYQTVFDVTSEPFRWGNAGEGLLALAIVSAGVAGFVALRGSSPAVRWIVLVAAAVGAFVYVGSTFEHWRYHERCVVAAKRGEGRVLEGEVQDFRPLPSIWQRPAYESFVVDGERVRYPMLRQGCGFHRSSRAGDPIRDGLRIRLREWQGEILKLEVARNVEPAGGRAEN